MTAAAQRREGGVEQHYVAAVNSDIVWQPPWSYVLPTFTFTVPGAAK